MEKFSTQKTYLRGLDLSGLDTQEEKLKKHEQEIILGMLGIWKSSETLGATFAQYK